MRTVLVVLVWGTVAGWAGGQELLPPPREAVPQPQQAQTQPGTPLPGVVVMPQLPALPPGIGFYRTSAYDHWQHMSTTLDGRWRPRVLTTPAGVYYSYDGRPYYWYGNDNLQIRGAGGVPWSHP